MKWEGKTVYITGGSSGIGLEVARQLAEKGARVALFARGEAMLSSVAAELQAMPNGPDVYHLSMDVSIWESVKRGIEQTVEAFGAPEVAINCAGIGEANYFEKISADAFDRTMAINVSGSRNIAAAVLPYLKRSKGALALVSSSAGLIPVFGYSAYGASKFAVFALAEVLRYEMKRFDVKVSLFCPSEVETPLLAAERLVIPKETRALKDFAGVISAEEAARSLISGIEKGRYMIIPDYRTKFLYWMRRITPGPLYRAGADLTAMMGAARK